MATLNKSKTATRNKRIEFEATTNFENAVAYTMNAKERLIERTVGAFWSEDTFYVEGTKIAEDIVADIKEVAQTDPNFVLQVAAWARNDLHMRTTPQVLLVEAANIEAAKPFIREYAPKIIKRADELAEVVAYQLSAHGKPIPNSLKKGLADAFSKFDEYQLNKYDSNKGSVSLGDVLHLIYRKEGYPVSKALWNYLVNDEVDAEALPKIGALKELLSRNTLDDESKRLIKKSNATWETVVSHFGSTKEVWESVIPNMGYMALLRNLRNFEQKVVDLEPVLARISDPEAVKRSKQLPFRFYSAYRNVNNADIKTAISRAFEASVSNVKLDGRTGIIVDLSGSMSSKASNRSDISFRDIASVMGAIGIKKSERNVVVAFADRAEIVNLNPDDTMMTNIKAIEQTRVGGATYADKGFELLARQGKFDRVFLLSDMQCYSDDNPQMEWRPSNWRISNVANQWATYRRTYPNARLYSFDLSAYGTKQLPTADTSVTIINGWSDKVFDYISLTESRNVIEDQIRKY